MLDFATAAGRNRRRSRALVVGLVIVAAAAGLAVDGALGTLARRGFPIVTALAIAGAAAAAAIAVRAGDRLVLAALGARPLDLSQPEERQLANLVQEMAVASGLPAPRALVVPDDAPNALATGRDPEHAAVAVTTGLLARLDRAETQGVIAHEIAHIGNRDTRLGVQVAVMLGAIALLSDLAWRVRWSAAGSDRDRADERDGAARARGGIALLVPLLLAFSALAPAASRLLALAISREREYLADASAVALTRNPLALADALAAIAADPRATRAGVEGTAHLFFARPRPRPVDERRGAFASWLATHPPIADRIARLRAMAGAPAEDGALGARDDERGGRAPAVASASGDAAPAP